MTMDPTATHPSDELLAAFADADDEATGDLGLSGHVAACPRCTSVVRELQDLRLALAQLPDVAPLRPLRVLPPVDEPRPGLVERLGGFSRRAFAPLMAVGGSLVIVGAVGGTGAAMSGMAASPAGEMVRTTDGAPGAPLSEDPQSGAAPSDGEFQEDTASPQSRDAAASPDHGATAEDEDDGRDHLLGGERESPAGALAVAQPPLWLVLLAGGAVLMAVAVTLRFVIAPRAG